MKIKKNIKFQDFYIRRDLTKFQHGGFKKEYLGQRVMAVFRLSDSKQILPADVKEYDPNTKVYIWGNPSFHEFIMYLNELEVKCE